MRKQTVVNNSSFSPFSAITFDTMSDNEFEDFLDEDMHPYISEDDECNEKDDDNEGSDEDEDLDAENNDAKSNESDEEDGWNKEFIKELDKGVDNQSDSESDKDADETVPPSDGEEDEGLSQYSLKSLRLIVNNVLDFSSQKEKKETFVKSCGSNILSKEANEGGCEDTRNSKSLETTSDETEKQLAKTENQEMEHKNSQSINQPMTIQSESTGSQSRNEVDDSSEEIASSPLFEMTTFKKEEAKALRLFIPVVSVMKERTNNNDNVGQADDLKNGAGGGGDVESKKRMGRKRKTVGSEFIVDVQSLEENDGNYSQMYFDQCSSWFKRETRKSNGRVSYTEDVSQESQGKKAKKKRRDSCPNGIM